MNGLVIKTDAILKEFGKASKSKKWRNLYVRFAINNQDYWCQISQPINAFGILNKIDLSRISIGNAFRIAILVKQSKNKSTKLSIKAMVQI